MATKPISLSSTQICDLLASLLREDISVVVESQQISIYIPIGLECVAVRETELAIENAGMRWPDLNNLLVEFWESRSIRVKIACTLRERPGVERTMRDWAEYLLPRLGERG